jgi:hypothetical protein
MRESPYDILSHWGSAYEEDREAEEIYPAKGCLLGTISPERQSALYHFKRARTNLDLVIVQGERARMIFGNERRACGSPKLWPTAKSIT